MRKVEKLTINYVGYQNPETTEEVELEILGLETAIANAQSRIAMLKQGLQLNKMMSQAKEEG